MTDAARNARGWLAPALVMAVIAVAFVATLIVATARKPPEADWLARRIGELSRDAPASPPRSIVATRYRGEPVYYIPRRCCDFPGELYSADGRLLCNPDGGFIGKDERCADFQPPGPEPKLVWVDPRP